MFLQNFPIFCCSEKIAAQPKQNNTSLVFSANLGWICKWNAKHVLSEVGRSTANALSSVDSFKNYLIFLGGRWGRDWTQGSLSHIPTFLNFYVDTSYCQVVQAGLKLIFLTLPSEELGLQVCHHAWLKEHNLYGLVSTWASTHLILVPFFNYLISSPVPCHYSVKLIG